MCFQRRKATYRRSMTGNKKRLIRAACEWCGKPIEQTGKGRPRLYCDRSCRQRAYEVRTAKVRQGEAQASGEVLPAPATRVVEAPYPTTGTGWVKALDELAFQLRNGHLPWQEFKRLHDALFPVLYELELPLTDRPVIYPSLAEGSQQATRPVIPELYIDVPGPPERRLVPSVAAGIAIARLLDVARVQRLPVYNVTCESLGRRLRADPEGVREALWFLCENGYAVVMRDGEQVDPRGLAVHNRIVLFLRSDPDGWARTQAAAPGRSPGP